LPWIEAGIAADNAKIGGVPMMILQCLFYPWLVPVLRFEAREKKQIEVKFLLKLDYFIKSL
jgi:hypothetical protein